MNPYRKRIWSQMARILDTCLDTKSILDFGCGDGWFASQVQLHLPDSNLTAIDVQKREHVLVSPLIYFPDDPIPFPNASFDLTYAIDVLHHCNSPEQYLDELIRVSRRYILIKDHTYTHRIGRLTLAILDELGNRRFGIPSPQNYQFGWAWRKHLNAHGWKLKTLIHPAPCHTGFLGLLTNRFQYIALYERCDRAREDAKLQPR